jgi:hypothetical protein
MQLRPRIKQDQPLDIRLANFAAKQRDEARKAVSVEDRERLSRAERLCETASHINDWITSTGLRSPK